MLGFVLALISSNNISNLEQRQSYVALLDDLIQSSTTILSNICWREYALTVAAIEEELPIRNRVSLASDGWTSTIKQAITSVIAYKKNRDGGLRQVQLAFDEVYRLFCFCFENQLRMIDQGPTYWSKAS